MENPNLRLVQVCCEQRRPAPDLETCCARSSMIMVSVQTCRDATKGLILRTALHSGQVANIVSDALFILLVEKDAAFMRLAEDRFYNTYPCIIITAKGQPDVASRRALSALGLVHICRHAAANGLLAAIVCAA